MIKEGEYQTKRGNTLYYTVMYDKGGVSMLSGQERARGYYLFIQRHKNIFVLFRDLSDEDGTCKVLLKEVSRASEKAQQSAVEMVEDTLKEVEASYAARGIEL